jgi:RHS repeat-associated protein
MDKDEVNRAPYHVRAGGATRRTGGASEVRPDASAESPSTAEPAEPAKTSSGERLPSISLPKGGGAIRGLGEKFSVNAANGSASASIPLPLSAGRGGSTPDLKLTYDSGAGNGVFGFGWTLDTPAITHKTDKGLPHYTDNEESGVFGHLRLYSDIEEPDVFILSEAEDLVPVLDAQGERQSLARTVFGTHYEVYFYRPRIEGLYARIERWVATDTGLTHWRSISRDNVTTLYGYDDLSRVSDPADPTRIFAWRISRSWDDKGNVAIYTYVREDSAGVDSTAAHEVNRTAAIRGAQVYLKSISYAGDAPYLLDWNAETEPPLPKNWMIKVVLDYGDHALVPPTPQPDQPWVLRPDPFSTYRPAFELRTYRRVQRILVFHNFPNETTAGADLLVKSLDLLYSDQQTPTDPRNPIYTFLTSVTRTGYRQDGANLVTRSLPPLEFDYSSPVIGAQVQGLDRDSLGNLPEGIDGQRFRWLDLDGEGLPGILTTTDGGWWYKRNLGAGHLAAQPDGSLIAQAQFGPLEPVARIPSGSGLGGGQQFLDLAGDGRQDLVALAEPDSGFYRRSEDYDFEPLKRFALLPQVDWTDPNLRFIDLTGDGLADVLLTEDGLFTVYESLGETGFAKPRQVRTPWDEEKGPKLVLADGTDTIFIADMTGDGLNDLVRVRNGEACYWPNIGYGHFGSKVSMDRAPRFEAEESFDPRRIRLADVDGTGTADILYIGDDGVRVWFNQSGNAWSAVNLIAIFPSADLPSSVQVMDLLGTGTACLVWSSPLPGARTPLLYVDLMSGRKPHLMTAMRNNLGAETRIAYAPSTQFYVGDAVAGRPWATRLAFPVQVVTRCETIDWIGRNRQVARYAYHHGYFDGFEREFRGFGMVEQRDTEEFRTDTDFDDGDIVSFDQQSFSPPVLTRTWFHTGAFRQAIAVSRQYASEYWVEPGLRAANRAADAAAMTLPDTVMPDNLDALEIQEAYRSLKGHVLRVEIYAEDGTPQATNPYSIAETNFTITCLQRMGQNLHAVFAVTPRESLTFHYERAGDDPRVTHELTLECDAYGNPLRTVAVGYLRRAGYAPPEPALSPTTQAMLAYDQTRLHVQGAEHLYTSAIDNLTQWPDAYRSPTPAGTNKAEITGVAPTVKGNGVTNLFAFEEADGLWQSAWTGTSDIPYEQIPSSDVEGQGTPAAALTRRLIGQTRILFRSDDLSTLLAQGQVEPLAIPGQTYQAVFTPGQISDVFGTLVTAGVLAEGGYVQLPGETGWWAPSGRVYLSPGDADTPTQELANARAHFFQPRRAIDPFGGISRATYDAYDLLGTAATDPVGNVTSVLSDYRVLAAATLTDPNTNRNAVAFDALGMVVATAVMGPKGGTLGDSLTGFEADPDAATLTTFFANPLGNATALVGNATTRLVYDLDAYQRTSSSGQPSPPVAATLSRETHVSDLSAGQTSALQYGLAYSDGFGREIQRKARVADGPLVEGGAIASPRWLGSGWIILDNKGRPVRQYEPFFTATSAFEFAAQSGVASTLFYDPPGRALATLHPDQTWTKSAFTAWRQEAWDGNDTVLIGDPRTDADVGNVFARALGNGPFTSWYEARINGTYGATAEDQDAQKDAAQKAAAHAATPQVTHFDALGRACLTVDDCGGGQRFPTRMALDTEGKPLAVIDALGHRTQQHVLGPTTSSGVQQYLAGKDMNGGQAWQINADAGARRTLGDVTGKPIRAWDARQHAFRMTYDAARRPVQRHVSTGGAAEILIELTVWGEGQAASANLGGRVFRHYDQAGFTENTTYDYAGNLTASRRQLGTAYHATPDWNPLVGLNQASNLDTAAQTAGLIPTGDGDRDSFVQSAQYDALNRPIQTVTPYSATMKPNVLRSSYDAGAQLFAVDVWLQQATAPTTLLSPSTADRHAVTSITYNPRGQRASIALGNGVSSAYSYDTETFRLINLSTTRAASFPADQRTVQNLKYYYDPVGNITRIRDDADTQNVIFFDNQRVEPSADYTYDPLYRLVTAIGREHLGQAAGTLSAPQQVTNDDSFRMHLPQPGDGNAMGVYTESYSYDSVGNLLAMSHRVSSGNWTRRYAYAATSQILPGEVGNRLSSTSLPGDSASPPYSAAYAYNEHGSMTAMPHLPLMAWDEDERLRSTFRQIVNSGTPATTWYVYGFDGGRVRKVSDGTAGAGQAPVRSVERVYLGGVEVYREYAVDGTSISLARETLHVDAGGHPIAFVEIRTAGADRAPAQQVRYQHSNHLGSAMLELGDDAGIISYEEYFPFGATSYQAVSSQTDVPKRYRYTDKERDEENDLYYHGARYFAPWLGRWTACDPKGFVDSTNLYAYCRNRPINLADPTGRQGRDPTTHEVETLAKRGITDPDIVRRLVNLFPSRPPIHHGTGTGGTAHAAEHGRHGEHGGSHEGGPGEGGSGGQPGGGTRDQSGSASGSLSGRTVDGSGIRREGAARTSGVGGTGKGPDDPNARPLTEMDYGTLLVSALAGVSTSQSKDGASGGIPGGKGPAWMASRFGQAAYIAVNLFFTFASGLVESGFRKAWTAAKPVLKSALMAPAFAFTSAGAIGSVPKSLILGERGITVRNAFPKAPEHHIFPQEQELREWFAAPPRNINIDEYAAVLDQGVHEAIHKAGWNADWKAYKAANEAKHYEPSEQEVFEFAGRLMDKYLISDAPIVTFGANK